MLNALKEKALSKGMQLLNSPVVQKTMESEQVGMLLEKAMNVPIKVAETVNSGKQRISSFMDLATQADLDELKRALARVEDKLSDAQKDKS
jgi:ABC-type Mn2+/Zn2+ transport system ATPase subunit